MIPAWLIRQRIVWEKKYTHPLYTVEGQEAQKRLPQLNQKWRDIL